MLLLSAPAVFFVALAFYVAGLLTPAAWRVYRQYRRGAEPQTKDQP